MRRIRLVLVAAAVGLLAACNPARVRTSEAYLGPPMPRPDRVVVSYFSISPEEVRLDQGVGARIMRAAGDKPLTAQEQQAALAVQMALAEELVARLRRYGLPAELAAGGTDTSRTLLVQGQIVGIDQGNRTRRVLIGLGAGKSSISADTQLFYAAGDGTQRFMTAFEGQADSGHMPGAAETMGAGAAAQRLETSAALTGAAHVAGESRRTSDTAEAGELADEIASQIGAFAVARGWITQAAIR
jgi:hypothetical protein